jgi:hypothetical protein
LSHIASAISELERQKEIIDRALSALRALEGSSRTAVNNSDGLPRKKGRLSAEDAAHVSRIDEDIS